MRTNLVYKLLDPDYFVDHLRKVPANGRPRFVSRVSMATVLKVTLESYSGQKLTLEITHLKTKVLDK